MPKIRVIPVLLLRDWGLEKSVRFSDYVYVGCPINAARVFNEHNVDELILLDIVATRESRLARTEIVSEIAEESFMPFTVGGGVRSVSDVRSLLKAGADRVAINTAAVETPNLVAEAASRFGSQCVVVSIDARRTTRGSYEVFTHAGSRATGLHPVDWAQEMEKRGAGEVLLTSIDQDGTMDGYDVELIRSVADSLTIPVIACGGAGKTEHLAGAVDHGHASAVAAGAFFLFFGARRTVLITFPRDDDLIKHLGRDRVRARDKRAAPPDGYL